MVIAMMICDMIIAMMIYDMMLALWPPKELVHYLIEKLYLI